MWRGRWPAPSSAQGWITVIQSCTEHRLRPSRSFSESKIRWLASGLFCCGSDGLERTAWQHQRYSSVNLLFQSLSEDSSFLLLLAYQRIRGFAFMPYINPRLIDWLIEQPRMSQFVHCLDHSIGCRSPKEWSLKSQLWRIRYALLLVPHICNSLLSNHISGSTATLRSASRPLLHALELSMAVTPLVSLRHLYGTVCLLTLLMLHH